jgi:hypothetical protein
MSDSRSLESDKGSAGYHSLAAFINAAYARRWGYDFIYIRTPEMPVTASISDFVRVTTSLGRRLLKGGFRSPTQERTCCYNAKLREPRCGSFAKLVAMRDAVAMPYDTIVYIDSDCVFRDHERSVEDFTSHCPVHRGVPFDQARIGFLRNIPWTPDLPCAGFFIARNGPETRALLRKWWDYPNPEHAFQHDFEQSSLREIYPEVSSQICVWDAIFFQEQEGQWLRHVSSDQRELRMPYFSRMVEALESSLNEDFSTVMSKIDQRLVSSPSW